MEKKHTRNFSLDVHPYMLTIRKPKVEAATTEPLPTEHNMDTVYLEGTHTIVHVSGAITGEPDLSFAFWFRAEFITFHRNLPVLDKCRIPSRLAVPCICQLATACSKQWA